jgi:hypothetical protein
MSVQFKIFPDWNLLVFTYSEHVTYQESSEVVAAATTHPAHRKGMRQLCDVSQVTSVERNFPKLMKMQAKMAEDLALQAPELFVIFYAPNRAGRQLAEMARRSWEGLDSVIVLVHDREANVISTLGLPEMTLGALLETANQSLT